MKRLGLKQEYKEKQTQDALKKSYGIKKDVLVVERKSRTVMLAKALLSFSLSLLRILGMVVLCILATIGLMTLVYPSMRSVFSTELHLVWQTIKEFVGL